MTSASRKSLLALCATTLLAGCTLTTGPAGVPVPPPSAATVSLPDPEMFTLENGLAVWLLHSDHVPLAAASLIVRTGSSSDPKGKDGLLSLALDMMDAAGEPSI